MGQVPDAMAAELGDAVVLGAPVTGVTATADRVEVRGAGCTVSARRVVLALPRALAAGIRFDPALPADHALLIHQVPAGTEIKMVAVYDEPFWRHDGISGATVATDDDIEVTLDTGQPNHSQGIVAGYAAGPRARSLAALGEAERRDVFVQMLMRRLGPRASAPVEVLEQNWAQGGMDPWLLHGPLPHRRPDAVRAALARAGRASALGRHRDGVDVVWRHGRRRAFG